MPPPPPSSAVLNEVVAPERDREAGSHLPRKLRDEVARRFMETFPGMTGATAVRYARSMLADPDRFVAEVTRPRLGVLDRERLARLMSELPHGALRPRKVAPRQWAVTSS